MSDLLGNHIVGFPTRRLKLYLILCRQKARKVFFSYTDSICPLYFKNVLEYADVGSVWSKKVEAFEGHVDQDY